MSADDVSLAANDKKSKIFPTPLAPSPFLGLLPVSLREPMKRRSAVRDTIHPPIPAQVKTAPGCVGSSETRKWCLHTDSNRGPIDYKSIALPAEL